MLAFHGDPSLKTSILSGLAIHRAADEIIQGTYWENGKGCAVGCTLESIRKLRGLGAIDHSSHRLAETETGIPQILWRLEDRIFEGLSNQRAKDWPERFISAIRPGADLAMVWPHFALWILAEELPYVTKRPKTAEAIADVAALYKEWCETCKNPTAERWLEARKNAASAAAYAADAAAAADADADAAYAAYAAAADAASAAAYAADAAADADADADAAYAAYAAAYAAAADADAATAYAAYAAAYAASAADAAAAADADAATAYAAYAAAHAAAADADAATAYVAYAAAYAASAGRAYAAAYAAYAADADAAYAADADADARASRAAAHARREAYQRQAEKLIELLKAA